MYVCMYVVSWCIHTPVCTKHVAVHTHTQTSIGFCTVGIYLWQMFIGTCHFLPHQNHTWTILISTVACVLPLIATILPYAGCLVRNVLFFLGRVHGTIKRQCCFFTATPNLTMWISNTFRHTKRRIFFANRAFTIIATTIVFRGAASSRVVLKPIFLKLFVRSTIKMIGVVRHFWLQTIVA